MGVSPSGCSRWFMVLTLIGCAALVFGSGIDHNHVSPVAVDSDCMVCEAGNAKNLAVVCALSAPLVFVFENEVRWTASNPFLTRFSKSAPRAPPQQLAFV